MFAFTSLDARRAPGLAARDLGRAHPARYRALSLRDDDLVRPHRRRPVARALGTRRFVAPAERRAHGPRARADLRRHDADPRARLARGRPPYAAGRISQTRMLERAFVPLRDFMLRQTHAKDLAALRPARACARPDRAGRLAGGAFAGLRRGRAAQRVRNRLRALSARSSPSISRSPRS